MKWLWLTLEIIWGVLCVIGWIAGTIAWAQRGFAIPKVVHLGALALLVLGVVLTAGWWHMGILTKGFGAFALLGFPAWAYVGWFFFGCPIDDEKKEEDPTP